MRVGGVLSFTVTLKELVVEFVPASVAVQVTVVVPRAKADPDNEVQATVALPQLSDVVGV